MIQAIFKKGSNLRGSTQNREVSKKKLYVSEVRDEKCRKFLLAIYFQTKKKFVSSGADPPQKKVVGAYVGTRRALRARIFWILEPLKRRRAHFQKLENRNLSFLFRKITEKLPVL